MESGIIVLVVVVVLIGLIVYGKLRNPNKMTGYEPKAQKVAGDETVLIACLMAP